MEQTSALLGLLAQTSIHAGTGQQTGIIDLPIQREGHNGWPCVFGSAVKGALRNHAEMQQLNTLKQQSALPVDAAMYKEVQQSDEITTVFGPPPSDGESKHAGAMIISDARLLLFPVRSLTSQFKWVTCPAALNRLHKDARRFGLSVPSFADFNLNDKDNKAQAIVPNETAGDDLFLEEYRFSIMRSDMSELITVLAKLMDDRSAKDALKKQLVVVSDDYFAHLVQHATPVNAHISINSQTKTVNKTGLWYEETLPPETLLYVGISANDSRNDQAVLSAENVLAVVLNLFAHKPWLQLGGNETTGMGWCDVKPLALEG